MRILHVNAGEVWSGIEQRIFFVAKYLKDRGIYCALGISPASPLWNKAEEESIPLHPLCIKRKWDFGAIVDLRRIIKKEKIDILHTHRSTDHWLGALSARFLPVKIVRTRHNFTSIPNNICNSILYHRWTHHFILVAEKIRDNLQRIGIPPSRVSVIHSAVDVERFPGRKGVLREELRISNGIPLVGMVGRIREHKDYPTFLEFARLLLKDFPGAHFVIAGEGPLENEIRRRAEMMGLGKRVHFIGGREDIADVISSFDVFVLTSKIEGSPAVIKEAMLCRVPVVATCVGGIPEIIEDGRDGLLVESGNPFQIKDAVTFIITHPEERKRMIENAERKILYHFHPYILGRETLRVYEKILSI